MDEAAADVEVLVAVAPLTVAVFEVAEGVTLLVEICVLITVEPSRVTVGVEIVKVIVGRVDVSVSVSNTSDDVAA